MHEYDTLDELFLGAVNQCLDEGHAIDSRDGGVAREVLGFSARLNNPACNFMFNPVRRMSPHYAAGELFWYLSGDMSLTRILPYAPGYKRFGNEMTVHRDPDTGKESRQPQHPASRELCAPGAAYGHRLARSTPAGYTQIAFIIRTLKQFPNSRQAILGIWDPSYDPGAIERGRIITIPCTLNLQFLIRDGKLNCINTMRSNDMWLGLSNDIFCFTAIQRLIADALRIPVGWYQHQVGSLHIYERDLEKCSKATQIEFSVPTSPAYTPTHAASGERLSQVLEDAVDLEESIREDETGYITAIGAYAGKYTYLHDLLCMAGSKWDKRLAGEIENKSLRKYTEEFVNVDT